MEVNRATMLSKNKLVAKCQINAHMAEVKKIHKGKKDDSSKNSKITKTS